MRRPIDDDSLPAKVDCLIVGGGPAGAALAGLLARSGHIILVVDDGALRTGSPLETLMASALQSLDRCGLGEIVRATAEVDRRRHGARWDADEVAWRDEGRSGLCLRRGVFDDGLRDWAVKCGARVLRPATAVELPDGGQGSARIRVAGRDLFIEANTIAIATGRRSVAVLASAEIVEQGPPTAAFAFQIEAESETGAVAMVTAAPDGWCWWIGDERGGARLVATVDADTLGEPLRAVVDRVLEYAGSAFGGRRAAVLETAVRATSRRATTPRGYWLVGDAAATLDPLASQGTEKALVGAESAALGIRTALANPALRGLAIAQHRRWEHELYQAHARTTAAFYSRVGRFAERPFWARRSQLPPSPNFGALPHRLVRAPDLLEGPMLVRHTEELVLTPGFARLAAEPIARIGRVTVAPLLAAFARPRSVADGLAIAGQDPRLFVMGSAVVRAAVVELWRAGLLIAPQID